MEPVFLHGNVCENQLLVDHHLRVTTVLDWDTCGIGHPLHDFDFGEWGLPLFRFEPEFPRLRQAAWSAYAAARAPTALPRVEEVNLVFALAEALSMDERHLAGGLDAWARGRFGLRQRALETATAEVSRLDL